MRFTRDYSAEIDRLKKEIQTADAIVIGAGAGLSTAAGFTYSGERFEKYFGDFAELPDSAHSDFRRLVLRESEYAR